MILRRISLERYGCFGSGEFDVRRGFNLVFGGNETGKTLLLTLLPAVILGIEHGVRLRSWGDSLSCRAALLFESDGYGVRLTRELENDLVRLEERSAEGRWQECFSGKVPPGGTTSEQQRYHDHLQRIFGISGEPLLRALLDTGHGRALLDPDGRLAAGLLAAEGGDNAAHGTAPDHPAAAPAARQAEIAALEAELVAGREEFRQGEEYLAWVRRRWAKTDSMPPSGPAATGREAADLEKQRNELMAELRKQGLPTQLPADLSTLFAAAEELRQELAVLQQELIPLQRSRQGLTLPASTWPLLVTLVALAAPAAAYYLRSPWLVAAAGGAGSLLLLAWGVFLARLLRVRSARTELDHQIRTVESRRATALQRQGALAERFEALGLPSAPVEMVKLQQLCQRHQGLLDRYRIVNEQLGLAPQALAGTKSRQSDDRHLRPEELPDAERRLDELGASLRRLEGELQALRNGRPSVSMPVPATLPAPAAPLSRQQLLPAIGLAMERLSGGRYHEVRLDAGRLHLEGAPGQWIVPAACSRGTVETLALAIRLALFQNCRTLLPLTVDDLPANLDARHRQAVLRTLERFAVDHQLLLASCDEELAKRAGRERWHVINLSLPNNQPSVTNEESDDAGQLHLL